MTKRWVLLATTSMLWTTLARAESAPVAPAAPAPQPDETTPFTSFSELKNQVVSKMGAATTRVWLATDFLSDGDIVSSLHLAKYRKVDVQALLGQKKVNAYMSRVAALKNQDIPTFVKPAGFSPPGQSSILVDDQLYLIDGDLDFMTSRRAFILRSVSAAQSKEFKAAFEAAVSQGLGIQPSPVPVVGRKPRNAQWGKAYVPGVAGKKTLPEKQPATPKSASAAMPEVQATGGEPYRYRRGNNEARPAGIPNKLPKALKWKEIEKARKNQDPPPDGEK